MIKKILWYKNGQVTFQILNLPVMMLHVLYDLYV